MLDVWVGDEWQPLLVVVDVVQDGIRTWVLQVGPDVLVVEDQIDGVEGQLVVIVLDQLSILVSEPVFGQQMLVPVLLLLLHAIAASLASKNLIPLVAEGSSLIASISLQFNFISSCYFSTPSDFDLANEVDALSFQVWFVSL